MCCGFGLAVLWKVSSVLTIVIAVYLPATLCHFVFVSLDWRCEALRNLYAEPLADIVKSGRVLFSLHLCFRSPAELADTTTEL